jgi:hypothetical protein
MALLFAKLAHPSADWVFIMEDLPNLIYPIIELNGKNKTS